MKKEETKTKNNTKEAQRGEDINTEKHWPIHHQAPSFAEIVSANDILETGIKVIDLMTPYVKGGKIGLSFQDRI